MMEVWLVEADAHARVAAPLALQTMPAVIVRVLSLFSVVVAAWAYGPLLLEFSGNLWEKPYYQHFPFVLVAAGVLAFQQTRSVGGQDEALRRFDVVTIAGYVLAWLLLALAYQVRSPVTAAISLMLLLGGWGRGVCKRMNSTFPTGPWLLLLLLIPPPVGLDRRLIESLQRASSSLASRALDLLGVNHLMDGNALVLPSKQLFVDEACSGIVSVISIVACAAIYGVWRRRPAVHTLLMVVAAAGWATLMNVVRIVTIALAEVWADADWTNGASHTLVALVAFVLSLIALVATDWLLRALLAEVRPRWEQMTGEPIGNGLLLTRVWDWLVAGPINPFEETSNESLLPYDSNHPKAAWGNAISLGILPTLAFAGLAASQLTAHSQGTLLVSNPVDINAVAGVLQQDALPDALPSFELVDIERLQRDLKSDFGSNSVVYHYRSTVGHRFDLSCDFPFQGGWHELAVCYQGIGWRLEQSEVLQASDETQATYDVKRLELTKPDGNAALVTYCACQLNGDPIAAPAQGLWQAIASAATGSRGGKSEGVSFQVQVLAVRAEGITDRDRREAEELVKAARKRFIEVFRAATAN